MATVGQEAAFIDHLKTLTKTVIALRMTLADDL